MKTSELKGAALDWAVEIANNPTLRWGETIGLHWASNTIVIPSMDEPDCYRHPSTDWAQGGPILEREKITVAADSTRWLAMKANNSLLIEWGASYLEAAMRCYVALKLGDDIDIPKELEQ